MPRPIPVLIADAGPVGLTFAADLAWRGVASLIVDPQAEVHPHPRAIDAGVPLSIVTIDATAIAALYERRLVLVRPDGQMAWRSDAEPGDAATLIARIAGGQWSKSITLQN